MLLLAISMLSLLSAASATPAVELIFGPADSFVAIVLAGLAIGLLAFSSLFDLSVYGIGAVMSADEHAAVRQGVRDYGCGFFALPNWFIGGFKSLGYILVTISLTGYTLHEFLDPTTGVSIVPALPATFNTWITWVWLTTVGAIVFDKMGHSLHAKCSMHAFAAVAFWFAFVGWVGSVVFLILEFVNLAGTSAIQWEIFHTVVVGLWVLVGLYTAIRYSIIAYLNSGGYEKMN